MVASDLSPQCHVAKILVRTFRSCHRPPLRRTATFRTAAIRAAPLACSRTLPKAVVPARRPLSPGPAIGISPAFSRALAPGEGQSGSPTPTMTAGRILPQPEIVKRRLLRERKPASLAGDCDQHAVIFTATHRMPGSSIVEAGILGEQDSTGAQRLERPFQRRFRVRSGSVQSRHPCN